MSDEKLDLLLIKATRLESAIWPDPNQPSVFSRHDKRMDEIDAKIEELDSWKNRLIGAWTGVTGLFGTVLGIHLKRHGG